MAAGVGATVRTSVPELVAVAVLLGPAVGVLDGLGVLVAVSVGVLVAV